MKRNLAFVIVCVLFLVGSIPTAQAKTPIQPLYIMMGLQGPQGGSSDDLWTYDGNLKRRTQSGYSYSLVQSPTGTWAAYRSVPTLYVNTPDTFPAVPMNIWIINTLTHASRQLTDQPADGSLEEGSYKFILRSQPSWSPDGLSLAWTEIAIDESANQNTDLKTERLVIYDIGADNLRVLPATLPNHGFVSKDPTLSSVTWGYPGLAVKTTIPSSRDTVVVISIYDTEGKLLSRTPPLVNTNFPYSDLIWIESDGKDYLSNVVGEVMIDPLTGEMLDMPGTPEIYSPGNPDGISMYFGGDFSGEGGPVWTLAVNGKPKAVLASAGRYYYQSGIAISPDGTKAAYIIYPGQGTSGGLYMFLAGNKVQLLGSSHYSVNAVAWGPVAWRVRPMPKEEGGVHSGS